MHLRVKKLFVKNCTMHITQASNRTTKSQLLLFFHPQNAALVAFRQTSRDRWNFPEFRVPGTGYDRIIKNFTSQSHYIWLAIALPISVVRLFRCNSTMRKTFAQQLKTILNIKLIKSSWETERFAFIFVWILRLEGRLRQVAVYNGLLNVCFKVYNTRKKRQLHNYF